MRWVPTLPGLGEWGRVVTYRRIQLDKLKRRVEVITGTRVDAQAVREYGADLVVIATGAHWAKDGLSGTTHAPIPGADATLDHVLTPDQLMVEGKPVPGDRVLVYDCDGYYMGIGVAEKLAREGRAVTFVTPHAVVSPYSFFTLEGPRVNKQLLELGVDLVTEHVVTSIAPGGATGANVYTTDQPVEWDVDAIVLATQRVSDDALYRELKADPDALEREGVTGLYRIGDCVVPRLIADAVFDGHRLAREIDSDDPSTPLPFIRENRVIGATDADYDSTLSRNGADRQLASTAGSQPL
jgi:dimethylamine/trimethylamine dehydrogenase